jgi:hypothetical protein
LGRSATEKKKNIYIYKIMGPPPDMRSVVDRNVVMQRIPVNHYCITTMRNCVHSAFVQMATHFVDPRNWSVSFILPEDDPLRFETCSSYVRC